MKRACTYLLMLCFGAAGFYAQNRGPRANKIQQLQKTSQDSVRIRIYLELASDYASSDNDSSLYYISKAENLLPQNPNLNQEAYAKYLKGYVYYVSSAPEKSQSFVNEALMISKGTNDKPLLAKCYNLLGALNFNLGNYADAFDYYNNKLRVVNELHDTLSIIETHYNISLINNAEGSFYRSLEHNYTGLNLSERKKDTLGILIASEGLGIAYTKIGDAKNAILFLKKALQLSIITNKAYEQSGILVDLGNVYVLLKQFTSADHYYQRAGEIAFRNGDKLTGSLALSGKGGSFFEQGRLQEAKALFERALYFYESIGYVKGLAENEVKLAECDLGLGNQKAAKAHALNALAILKQLQEKQIEEEAYYILSQVYEKLDNTDSAFFCYKKHILISDSLQAKAALRKISEYESNLEKKKLEQERAFSEKTARAELLKQKQIRNTVLALSAVILMLLLFVNRNYKLKQKANIAISDQKKIIEHKNKDIVDSINYSRRLQEAVLTTPAEMRKLLPEAFVLYRPKGNVSSVFYFVERAPADNRVHIAVARCTGEGVPGAFMSIIGHGVLKQALKEPGLASPAKVIDFLDRGLKKFLRAEEASGLTDGISIAYCILDKEKGDLNYAGASCTAWLFRTETGEEAEMELVSDNGARKLYKLKPDESVAGLSPKGGVFHNQSIKIKPADMLLLCQGIDLQSNKGLSAAMAKHLGGQNTKNSALQGELEAILGTYFQTGTQREDICIIGINI